MIDPTIGALVLIGVDVVLAVVLIVTIVLVRRYERETRAALGSILRPMNHVFYGNTDIGPVDTRAGDDAARSSAERI